MRRIYLLIIFACFSQLARSHQQQEALTTILFNNNSGNIEIVHRIYLHDAEHVAKALSKTDYDLISSPKAREIFARYITKHFSITFGKNKTSNLTKVGEETEGKFFWVYQETPIPKAPTHKENTILTIKNTILMDYFPKQKNRVNVEQQAKISTLVFQKGAEEQAISTN